MPFAAVAADLSSKRAGVSVRRRRGRCRHIKTFLVIALTALSIMSTGNSVQSLVDEGSREIAAQPTAFEAACIGQCTPCATRYPRAASRDVHVRRSAHTPGVTYALNDILFARVRLRL